MQSLKYRQFVRAEHSNKTDEMNRLLAIWHLQQTAKQHQPFLSSKKHVKSHAAGATQILKHSYVKGQINIT